ncbi:WD40 repeat domain-containing protein [Amycolatopsis roodepoortensis]|uniref:WD40 repeat domain-containing protein n=1 Tax=Amycolatopsis roodepoortensis TaxID=700274 RepID=UPI00214CB1F1|nr:WD40 repeat domain-containing protein [Amycolatopsis roodepoortensis]UUV34631.1 WD40 repeat domain-containing protein [Amycolatopsis roodepoortensis]
MPRRERPLGPGDDVVVSFAADLRLLREKAGGPTYRELSTRAGYSAAALSEAAGGRKLPGLAVTTAYVTACGGDVPAWEERWRTVAAGLAAAAGERDETELPYLGLAAFQTADAARFFGRERLVAELAGKLAERRLVGVFGASGSGKSSVLRAGLAASSERPVVLRTPGAHPLEEDLDAEGRLLIVDQFEEVYTLCRDQAEREKFVDVLLALSRDEHGTRVVLGVRADFYGHLCRHAGLVEALTDAQVMVGPMTADELRTAIVEPAVRAGCRVEAALVTTLVADATGQPAMLPLVSHALLETWRRRQGITLTSAAYEAAGGILNAIAQTAEAVYTDLEPDRQRLVRQIFLRLTALGEGTEDTKRRLNRRELDDDPATTEVLERLAEARLLVLDRDGVEIAHEALIRGWPRLRDWLAEDREGHRLHRQLAEATELWESLDRDKGSLYRGTRLGRAAEWAEREPGALSARERQFLQAGLDAEAEETAVGRKRTRRLRRLVALLGVLLLLAGVAVGYAVDAGRTATDQRNVALARKAVVDAKALRDSNPALSTQLSLAAYRLAPIQETHDGLLAAMAAPFPTRMVFDPGEVTVALSGQLMVTSDNYRATQVWSIADTRHPALLATLPGSEEIRGPLAFSRDGRALATATRDHRVRLWELTDPRNPVRKADLTGHRNTLLSLDFSPDGRRLASGSVDRTVQLTDVGDLGAPKPLGGIPAPELERAVFNPDGTMLAVTSTNWTAELWDVTAPSAPRRRSVLSGHKDLQLTPAWSPDGRRLLTTSWDRTAKLWDVADPAAPRSLSTLTTPAVVWAAGFSPSGRLVVTAGDDQSVRLWDVTGPAKELPPLSGHTNAIWWTAFSPDGKTIVSASADRTVRLQDVGELALASSVGWNAGAFTEQGRILVTAGDDARLWAMDDLRAPRQLSKLPGPATVTAVALSPDRRSLALAAHAGAGVGGTFVLQRWDIADPMAPRLLASTEVKPTYSLAFSPDGKTFASGHDDGPVQLWDVGDPGRFAEPRVLPVGDGTVWSLAFTPDGRTLVAAQGPDSSAVTLWDVTDPRRPGLASTLKPDAGAVFKAAVSPDGRTVAAGSSDRNVYLWDIADRAHPVRLAKLGGNPEGVGHIAFGPSGRELAASAFRTVRVWDIADPRKPVEKAQLTGFAATVNSLVYRDDGHTLAIGSSGVQLWQTNTDRVSEEICALATPRITREEWERYFPGLDYAPPCG